MTEQQQAAPSASGTCPRCRHAAHADWCPNMASDNDCSCTYDSNAAPDVHRRSAVRGVTPPPATPEAN